MSSKSASEIEYKNCCKYIRMRTYLTPLIVTAEEISVCCKSVITFLIHSSLKKIHEH